MSRERHKVWHDMDFLQCDPTRPDPTNGGGEGIPWG